jgi:hypothetical protein
MNLTLPQITEVIAYDPPPPPGTVYTAWSPRTGSQSPDINPPTDEFVVLSWMAHEADEAETQPVIDLAAAMPQPDGRPDGYRSRHRAKSRWARDAVLHGSGMIHAAVWLLIGAYVLAAIR